MYKFRVFLSEEDDTYLVNSILVGVALGLIIGLLIEKVILTFAIGGIIGILYALIRFTYKIFIVNIKKDTSTKKG